MAEAWLNQLHGDRFEAESAGIEPGILNPVVVKAMQEVGLDISGNQTNAVADFVKEGRSYDYVITVCDRASAERCPYVPSKAGRIHWSFTDPSSFTGSEEIRLDKTREVRDTIRMDLEQWVSDLLD